MKKEYDENLFSLSDMLLINLAVYQVPNDRYYTIEDLLYNHQRYLNIYLNDREKDDLKAIPRDLMISLSWILALANCYHINIEDTLWKRYSYKCPFCLEMPCYCKEGATKSAQKTGRPSSRKPVNVREWQEMFEKIYPGDKIEHFHQKMWQNFNQLNSASKLFTREKRKKQFRDIEIDLTDYFVRLILLLNHYNVDLTKEFIKMFGNGCYTCKKIPCECHFFE